MSLHETAIATRKIIAGSIVGLIALVILVNVVNAVVRWWNELYPPEEQPPTVGFGKLPTLVLPSLSIKGSPTYLLETTTGELPEFPDRIEVVAMKEIAPSLLGEQKAKELAKDLDFAGEGELSGDKKAIVFTDTGDNRTLTIDLTTQNFALTTALAHIESTVPDGSALSSSEATENTKGFLQRLGLLKGDFDTGTQTTQTHRIVNGEIKDAPSISDAQFTRIDFFRNLSGISNETRSLLPPNPRTGHIQVWFTSGLKPGINNTLFILYTVWEMDKESVETYPLRTVSEAWEEVQNGEGIAEVLVEGMSPLDEYSPPTLDEISIRNVRLAYFDDTSYQNYLQPIYVFSGEAKTTGGKKADFTAYRPAIPTEWISE